jgi:hypothetical protein
LAPAADPVLRLREGVKKPAGYGALLKRLGLLTGKPAAECRQCFCAFDYKFEEALIALRSV